MIKFWCSVIVAGCDRLQMSIVNTTYETCAVLTPPKASAEKEAGCNRLTLCRPRFQDPEKNRTTSFSGAIVFHSDKIASTKA
jgi:hypothetical protein